MKNQRHARESGSAISQPTGSYNKADGNMENTECQKLPDTPSAQWGGQHGERSQTGYEATI